MKTGSVKVIPDNDLEAMDQLKTVLEPFKEATVMSCSEKTPTLSLLIPTISELNDHFNKETDHCALVCDSNLQKNETFKTDKVIPTKNSC